ncbi:MAG: PQQ-dependent sugar dehydrogenase [Chryseolinea sp.]
MKKNVLIAYAFLVAVAGYSLPAVAQTYPPSFGQVLVASGISNPTSMAFASDGRIFVAQQGGSLRVVKNNALLPTPFLTLTVSSVGERGLVGVTLDPDFNTNHYIYLYYTVPGTPAHNRVSRFTANGDVEETGSEQIILELDPLSSATNHNGGAMHFGLDGKLYIAVGENANSANAQNLNTYLGKLLRINKDGSIPAGNPFPSGTEQKKRVWAYGLRNPFTFSIHPTTGRILVNDVGQVTWEEINDATIGGKNFGWPTTEGFFNPETYPTLANPVYIYPHDNGDGNGCAITGGTFFYPTTTTNYPSNYVGWYFFQDLCNSWINTLDPNAASPARDPFATAIPGNSVGITTGVDGNLYFLGRNNGALYKIIYNNTTSPYITNQPSNATVAQGQNVSLSVTALGSTPLTYQWNKNGSPVAGATGSSFTILNAKITDAGDYTVTIINGSGTVTSSTASLTVYPNTLPVANILSPTAGTTYAGGSSINFNGEGNDAEDGAIPAASMQWNIDFYHDTHKHDQPAIEGMNGGTFVVPTSGETSDNVWYRITLTVTDALGMSGKDSVDILPRKSTLNFATIPAGLQLILDGQTISTPSSVVSVEGIQRAIGAVSPQTKDEIGYSFESWSNGGVQTQTISTPVDDVTITGKFSAIVGVEEEPFDSRFVVFPNPSNTTEVSVGIYSNVRCIIKLRMLDILSREIVITTQDLQQGNNEFIFKYGDVRNGLYSLVAEINGKTQSRKLLVNR